MKNIIAFSALIILVLSFNVCSHDCSRKNIIEISIASGGGFTGIWEGYIISADGTVYKWNGKERGENKQFYIKLNEEDLNNIFNSVRTNKIYKIEHSKPGNMSKKIRIKKAKSEKIWIWDVGDQSENVVKLGKVYKFILDYIEKKTK